MNPLESKPESQHIDPDSKVKNTLTAITVAKSIPQQLGFQTSIPHLVNSKSNIQTSSDQVIGEPMVGHDYFHSIANNLINKINIQDPEGFAEFANEYSVDLQNPSGFNYNGERLAMTCQDIVKSFSHTEYKGQKALVATLNQIPNPRNPLVLAKLMTYDMRTSLELHKHDYHKALGNGLILDFATLSNVQKEVKDYLETSHKVGAGFVDNLLHNIPAHLKKDTDVIFRDYTRYSNGYIDSTTLLKSTGHEPEGDLQEQLLSIMTNRVLEILNSLDNTGSEFSSKFNLNYFRGDLANYSLPRDIEAYLKTGHQSAAMTMVMNMFEKESGMDAATYVQGMAKISKLFLDFYFSEYSSENIVINGEKVVLISSQKMTQLENDVNIHNSAKSALESKSLEDLTVLTDDVELRNKLKSEYQDLIAPLKDKIESLERVLYLPNLPETTYDKLSKELDETKYQLKVLNQTDNAKKYQELLIKYYGFSNL